MASRLRSSLYYTALSRHEAGGERVTASSDTEKGRSHVMMQDFVSLALRDPVVSDTPSVL